jgi:hypothetical protein
MHGTMNVKKKDSQLFNPSKPSGYCFSTRIKVKKFYILPTQCIYAFYMDLKTKSDYFSYTALTDLFS